MRSGIFVAYKRKSLEWRIKNVKGSCKLEKLPHLRAKVAFDEFMKIPSPGLTEAEVAIEFGKQYVSEFLRVESFRKVNAKVDGLVSKISTLDLATKKLVDDKLAISGMGPVSQVAANHAIAKHARWLIYQFLKITPRTLSDGELEEVSVDRLQEITRRAIYDLYLSLPASRMRRLPHSSPEANIGAYRMLSVHMLCVICEWLDELDAIEKAVDAALPELAAERAKQTAGGAVLLESLPNDIMSHLVEMISPMDASRLSILSKALYKEPLLRMATPRIAVRELFHDKSEKECPTPVVVWKGRLLAVTVDVVSSIFVDDSTPHSVIEARTTSKHRDHRGAAVASLVGRRRYDRSGASHGLLADREHQYAIRQSRDTAPEEKERRENDGVTGIRELTTRHSVPVVQGLPIRDNSLPVNELEMKYTLVYADNNEPAPDFSLTLSKNDVDHSSNVTYTSLDKVPYPAAMHLKVNRVTSRVNRPYAIKVTACRAGQPAVERPDTSNFVAFSQPFRVVSDKRVSDKFLDEETELKPRQIKRARF